MKHALQVSFFRINKPEIYSNSGIYNVCRAAIIIFSYFLWKLSELNFQLLVLSDQHYNKNTLTPSLYVSHHLCTMSLTVHDRRHLLHMATLPCIEAHASPQKLIPAFMWTTSTQCCTIFTVSLLPVSLQGTHSLMRMPDDWHLDSCQKRPWALV